MRLIVLGDSYSDNGNVYALTQHRYPNSTAYYHGRFSNGPVWSEYFSELLKIDPQDRTKFINLGYGQAKISGAASITLHGNPDKKYSIPDLSGEIDLYVARHKAFRKNDIVTVFISTNDFFDVVNINDKKAFLKMADDEAKQIQRLVSLGAQHIIVFNGRDVTRSVLAKRVAQDDVYLKNFRKSIQLYNQRLAEDLSHTKFVIIYDVFKFDNKTFKNRRQGMCYQNSQGDYENIAGAICKNPSEYFYYDRIHTTATVNALLAKDVFIKFQK